MCNYNFRHEIKFVRFSVPYPFPIVRKRFLIFVPSALGELVNLYHIRTQVLFYFYDNLMLITVWFARCDNVG